jgi:hypothetical protein
MTAWPSAADLGLHAVRVAGWLAAGRLASCGVSEPEQVAAELVRTGLLRRVITAGGELLCLTPAGTERANAAVRTWLAGLSAGQRAMLAASLAGFERVDPWLKRLVTDWQRGAVPDVAAALAELHLSARESVEAIGEVTALWSSYPARFDNALRQVAMGEADYVASPLVESYHTVWHLMHRDMRLVLA